MRAQGSNRLAWISAIGLIVFAVATILVGFAWLPSVQADFRAQGIWDSICRAAGVPSKWMPDGGREQGAPTVASNVVLLPAMARQASPASVGRGATLALNCTMCHGAQGLSRSDAPNLAGQYPEVVIKQLLDYRSGKRENALMSALARGLSEQNIADLAAYYTSLPKARTAPTTYDETLPALVRVGDPMRNIAPCISCHGGVDQKLGAPWLEGMPKQYLVQQLQDFKQGRRKNDGQQQMRNVARPMSEEEIDAVAIFYARKALPAHQ
ncbi:c-type cytochrome [Duganella aceris]|uniref:C-type cytochrome n=1 Tax=Duganella aceris TaxID=2703883 RepID=A0ABX0FLJ2_9BURK|nr:c-type cytochrome [Duganella aceris]NGZ85416.1 c-type cytochrome [Duganella aceris]